MSDIRRFRSPPKPRPHKRKSGLVRECFTAEGAPKERYPNAAVAIHFAVVRRLWAYRCRACGNWHLATKKRSRR